MKSMKLGVLASLVVGLMAGNAFAVTYYARVDGDDSKDGKSWANAADTVLDAGGASRIIVSAPDIGCYEADDPGLLLFVQ